MKFWAVFLNQTKVTTVPTHPTMIFLNNHRARGYHSSDSHEGCILIRHLWDRGTDQSTKLSGDFVGSVTPSHKYCGACYFVPDLHVHNVFEDTRHSEHFCYSPRSVKSKLSKKQCLIFIKTSKEERSSSLPHQGAQALLDPHGSRHDTNHLCSTGKTRQIQQYMRPYKENYSLGVKTK